MRVQQHSLIEDHSRCDLPKYIAKKRHFYQSEIWNIETCNAREEIVENVTPSVLYFKKNKKVVGIPIYVGDSVVKIGNLGVVILDNNIASPCIKYRKIYIDTRRYFIDTNLLKNMFKSSRAGEQIILSITPPRKMSVEKVIVTYIEKFIQDHYENPTTGIACLIKISSLRGYIQDKFESERSSKLNEEQLLFINAVMGKYLKAPFHSGEIVYVGHNYCIIVEKMYIEDVENIIDYIRTDKDHVIIENLLLKDHIEGSIYKAFRILATQNTMTNAITKMRLYAALFHYGKYTMDELALYMDPIFFELFCFFCKLPNVYLGMRLKNIPLDENINILKQCINSINTKSFKKFVPLYSETKHIFIDHQVYNVQNMERCFESAVKYWNFFHSEKKLKK